MDIDPLQIVRTSKVFRRLPLDVLSKLTAVARVERFKNRTMLDHRSSHPAAFRYIITGGVQVSLTTADGREACLPPVRPGEWTPWPACFLDAPLAHDVWSSPSSIFLTFPMTIMRTAIFDHPHAMQEALEVLSGLSRRLVAWNLSTNLFTGERRLAQFLAYMIETQQADAGGRLETQLSQEEIGRLGFGTRHLVRQVLRGLEERGLIEMEYRAVKILSHARLREFAFAAAETPGMSD